MEMEVGKNFLCINKLSRFGMTECVSSNDLFGFCLILMSYASCEMHEIELNWKKLNIKFVGSEEKII